MSETTLSPLSRWRPIASASLIATIWALLVMLVVSTILMALTIGGFVVIVLIVMDAIRLGTIVLQGLILVGPVTFLVLPALALLGRHWPRLLRWILVLAGPLAGGWWGVVVARWWLDEGSSLDGFLAALGMLGGLVAGIVFARRVPRYAA